VSAGAPPGTTLRVARIAGVPAAAVGDRAESDQPRLMARRQEAMPVADEPLDELRSLLTRARGLDDRVLRHGQVAVQAQIRLHEADGVIHPAAVTEPGVSAMARDQFGISPTQIATLPALPLSFKAGQRAALAGTRFPAASAECRRNPVSTSPVAATRRRAKIARAKYDYGRPPSLVRPVCRNRQGLPSPRGRWARLATLEWGSDVS
jgi:hypothetical protein